MPLVPPLNFAMVVPGVYRAGYPNKKNHPFLRKLALRTIIYLCPADYSEENLALIQEESIRFVHMHIDGNKEPFTEIAWDDVSNVLSLILDQRNHPMLLHCNKGKHRVGCIVGCLRKLQNWSMTSIFEEYRRFSGEKIRIADQEFIEMFQAPVRYQLTRHISRKIPGLRDPALYGCTVDNDDHDDGQMATVT
ncbi:tyrosine-protein phosphatase siw14 [Sorochytrium milnesiophthora]